MEAEACFLQTRNRDTERLQCPGVMLKAQPLGTRAESNFRDRILVEVEKNSSVSLPGKGGHRNCYSQKMCPNPGGYGEEFYNNSSGPGLLRRIRCVQGLTCPHLVLQELQNYNLLLNNR